jgi:hypothetical protein
MNLFCIIIDMTRRCLLPAACCLLPAACCLLHLNTSRPPFVRQRIAAADCPAVHALLLTRACCPPPDS